MSTKAGAVARPEACPHCGATRAVPLSRGLTCTNAWHDAAPAASDAVVTAPDLTEGELAEILRRRHGDRDVDRLVAALRASRTTPASETVRSAWD